MGVMGKYMASNLAKSSTYGEVRVWNRSVDAEGVHLATSNGCKAFPTISEAVQGTSIVCICVSDAAAVKSVIEEATPNLPAGTLVIDFSTIGPGPTKEIGAYLSTRGLAFLDAPVSGGDVGAEKGTLTIMAGGTEKDFNAAMEAFEIMGKNIIHCGPLGSGQTVKMANQILCSLHMVGLCESLLMAKQSGVDPNLIVKVCSTGAAGSWALANLGPMIADSDYRPGFMIKHILKDIGIVNSEKGDLDLPGLALAEEQFKEILSLKENGGELGTQAMAIKYGM